VPYHVNFGDIKMTKSDDKKQTLSGSVVPDRIETIPVLYLSS